MQDDFVRPPRPTTTEPSGAPAPINDIQPTPVTVPPEAPLNAPTPPPRSSKKKWWLLGLLLLILAAAAAWWFVVKPHQNTPVTSSHSVQTVKTAPKTTGLQLDTSKNYGNKYANGILPVGDGKYSSDAPKTGYVYACSSYAHNLSTDQGGAGTRGPWFTSNNTEYDLNKKAHVQGSVPWQASLTNNVSGATRSIVTNDLPTHTTGVFPIASSDPAYAYDRNPNTIKGQTMTFNLAARPTYGNPNCIGGEVGVMLTGAVLFNGFDAGGRDAGAWEVQDSCAGHPQKDGVYHYHTLSSCIKDISVHTVIGFALDGFPITGPQVAPNNILTTADLDECHGITSQLTLDKEVVTLYHYVMTQDFPYSVSCYRSTAIQPPGVPSGPENPPAHP